MDARRQALLDKELYRISVDSAEYDGSRPWFSLIQNLTYDQLEELKTAFKTKCDGDLEELGLSKEEFLESISKIYGHSNYALQTVLLFSAVSKGQKQVITWNEFLEFLMVNLEPETLKPLQLKVVDMFTLPQTKRETIVKIVIIETPSYFCYAAISKYGRIGLYNGNMEFLTSYHVIMTKEDETRTEAERRRRNRWVTDAVFTPDVLMFIVTNTARSIMIYEASGLKHVPVWLILSTPNVIQSLSYRPHNKELCQEAILFAGDNRGHITSFTFLKADNGLMRKKRNDRISLFYWAELPQENEYVRVKDHGQIHKEAVDHIEYIAESGMILTCSRDPERSLVKTHIGNKKDSYVFKMKRGTTSFAISTLLKILITGSSDGMIRLWDPVISAKPAAILEGHYSEIVDIKIVETENWFFSVSSDGVMKVWNIKEEKSIETINIKFPCFKVPGKLIEWGINCIYPGPKRDTTKMLTNLEQENIANDEFHEEIAVKKPFDVWTRPYIYVACCNYVAKVKLTFSDRNVDELLEYPVLPPPPLQNSVLIPDSWKIYDLENEINTEEIVSKLEVDDVDKCLEHLKFVLDKNLLPESESSGMINYKIADLENQKMQMQEHVAKGAPFMALNLYKMEDFTLSDTLPMPSNRKSRYYHDIAHKILKDAHAKDIIFSEPSSNRSRSSRSSTVEFP